PTNKLKKFVRDAFLYESKWPQMFHLLGENCAVLAVKLVDKTKIKKQSPRLLKKFFFKGEKKTVPTKKPYFFFNQIWR
ncbi:hypothetical protein ACISSW_22875, partial [Escherichia coli]